MSPSADGRPIFVEIADQIADDILVGLYAEETQVPSTTELSVHYRINRLVDEGIGYKRRGLGMFVVTGAPDALRASRRAAFTDEYVRPFLAEGARLGLTLDEIVELIRKDPS